MEEVAVLDASALIALFYGEPGADQVAALLSGSLISTVNLAELAQVAAISEVSAGYRRDEVEGLGITIVPFTHEQAESAGAMHPKTRAAGLSLADRACLALAQDTEGVAITADRAWTEVDVGVEVRLIR